MNVRRLALALTLALAGPMACSASPELERIRTPRAGVSLAYVLPQGQGFEGQLRVGNTRAVDGLDAPLSQTATCDVNMVVLGSVPEGTEIRATFTSVDLDWDLPPAATYSSDELVELANERLRGMQVRFVVRPDGRVYSLPGAPAGTPPELAEVIETLLFGLEAFFVPLPPGPLGRGDEWSESFSHATAAGLTHEVDHRLRYDGRFRHKTDESTLVRLRMSQTRHDGRATDGDPVTVEREVAGVLLFDADGFPAELDREIKEFDPEQGMVFRKVRAQWGRFRGVVPELLTTPGTDVQVINDPCNPDYVGPKECEEEPDVPPPDAPPSPTPPPGDSDEPADADDAGEADDGGEAADDASEPEASDETEAPEDPEATDDADEPTDSATS